MLMVREAGCGARGSVGTLYFLLNFAVHKNYFKNKVYYLKINEFENLNKLLYSRKWV